MALRRLRALLGHVDSSADDGGAARCEPVAPGQELGPWVARNDDDGSCGASEGYPKWAGLTDLYGDRAAQQYLRAGCAVCPKYRVGNYVGLPGEAGFEQTFNYNVIKASAAADPSPLADAAYFPSNGHFTTKNRCKLSRLNFKC